MLRLLGAMLVMSACFAAAQGRNRRCAQELDTLRQLERALELMSAELSLRLTSLPELLKRLEKNSHGPVGRFFGGVAASMERLGELPFAELWNAALERNFTELDGSAAEALRALGSVLGRYELEAQLAAAADCRARLHALAEEKSAALQEGRRLSLGLSAAFGGLVCILLL